MFALLDVCSLSWCTFALLDLHRSEVCPQWRGRCFTLTPGRCFTLTPATLGRFLLAACVDIELANTADWKYFEMRGTKKTAQTKEIQQKMRMGS